MSSTLLVVFFLISRLTNFCYCPPIMEKEYGYGCGYIRGVGEGLCVCHMVGSLMNADCTQYKSLTRVPFFTSSEINMLNVVDMTGTLMCTQGSVIDSSTEDVEIVCKSKNVLHTKSGRTHHKTTPPSESSFTGLIAGVIIACLWACATTVTSIVICRVSSSLFQLIKSSNEALF